jgi:coproporphyrinogen III oxidase-like Fe-S oxidoreductase
VELLKQEYHIRFWDTRIQAESVHIGGGTPNMLSLGEMRELLQFLRDRTYDREEFSIELHPALLSYELFDLLAEMWVDRISLGIQTLDPHILSHHTRVDIHYDNLGSYIEYAKAKWFKKINLDFIYDLIGDSMQSVEANLDFIEKYRPTSIYYYKLRALTDYLRERHVPNDRRAFAYYLKILSRMHHISYDQLNSAVYFDDGALRGNPPFLYDEIIYSEDHRLIGLGVAATSDDHGNFLKNSISYENYKEKIASGNLATDLKFSISGLPYFYYRFYFFALQNPEFSLDVFLLLYPGFSRLDALDLIQDLFERGFVNFDNDCIKLTAKGIYYFDDRVDDTIFRNYPDEYMLLKKL